MASNQRETIEQVKLEAERLTLKRLREHQEELARQAASDEAQEATNKTKK
jgi:predicted nucleotidyltransferase